MPPLRSDRASRACEACRRLKTRCYPSKQENGKCLRCDTQDLPCSLKASSRDNHRNGVSPRLPTGQSSLPETRLESRLNTLESLVHTVVQRLDALTQQSVAVSESSETNSDGTPSTTEVAEQEAPVFLIRGIAEDVHIASRDSTTVPDPEADPVSNGTIALDEAYELLSFFRTHYGRWVNFDEGIPLDQLMSRVRTSSLLFHSICLVAARHTVHQNISHLAPTFFREAKRLLQASLLSTPQPIEFFQAALLLCLWSTTVGQVPLSVDSWLLTSYALQQGIASSMSLSIKDGSTDESRLRACCTWNHICLTHLQYCVGTGRKCSLQEAQIDVCAHVLDFDIPQFEVRMVAELRLYWVIVHHCCAPSVNLPRVRSVLSNWMKEWSFLFNQPRSQFLEMSYNFAVLLAHCRSTRSQTTKLSRSKLTEMVQRARDIINLAKDHTDERTPHLTDHIYHIITFSAITLCQLMTKYPNILTEPDDVGSLRQVILGLIDWLRSIGLSSHISHILADIIERHYAKCTNQHSHKVSRREKFNATTSTDVSRSLNPDPATATTTISQASPDTIQTEYPYQDFAWTSTFFDFDAGADAWPQGIEMFSSNYTPTNESWSTSAHATPP